MVDWLYLINANEHCKVHNGCICAAVTIFHDFSWKCVPTVAPSYRRSRSEMPASMVGMVSALLPGNVRISLGSSDQRKAFWFLGTETVLRAPWD